MRMPQVKLEITVGNILSMLVSLIAVVTMIVTVAVFGATLRGDIDSAVVDIRRLEVNYDKLDSRVVGVNNAVRMATEAMAAKNTQQVEVMTEVRVDVKYLREAISRLEQNAKTTPR